MKKLLISTLLTSLCFANELESIKTFSANFDQIIINDKNKTLSYSGNIKASKPYYALWNYKKPIEKNVYILRTKVMIVENELEQVVIKSLDTNFNFFNMIKNAKQISKNKYTTKFKDKVFLITIKNHKISAISYQDDFDNNITINFKNQKINEDINLDIFDPIIPLEYDIIRE